MGTPANPGWPTGYVPSASEWAQAFSSKVDFPAPVSQGGTGALSSSGANYNILQRGLASADVAAQALTRYGLRTGSGPFSVFLPPIASLAAGDWIDVYDVDFNAAVNNINVIASGTDQIYLFGVAAGTQTLNVSGVRATLVVNTSAWSMIV